MLTLAAALAWPLPGLAQGRPAGPLPEALNVQAAVPPARHLSAFAGYRRAIDTTVGSWRDANDTVTRIGGWRVYTREAHAPEPPASAPAAGPAADPRPPVPASGSGHGGHHGPVGVPPSGGRP